MLSPSHIKIPNSTSDVMSVEDKSIKTEHMKQIKRVRRDPVTDKAELQKIQGL